MQLLLPIFPKGIKLITPSLGVFEKDDIVNYIHSGVPIFSHASEDLSSFRYITSKYILQHLCRQTDIVRTFSVSPYSVSRYVKRLKEQGEEAFFSKDNRQGHCYKLLPEKLNRIQGYLDKGMSNNKAAQKEGVTEGAIRYAIKKGVLKKNFN